MFKLIPLLCTHVYSYMFSTVHPRVQDQASNLRFLIVTFYWLTALDCEDYVMAKIIHLPTHVN